MKRHVVPPREADASVAKTHSPQARPRPTRGVRDVARKQELHDLLGELAQVDLLTELPEIVLDICTWASFSEPHGYLFNSYLGRHSEGNLQKRPSAVVAGSGKLTLRSRSKAVAQRRAAL